jgi:AraC-like DNA-binding protein
MVNPNKKENSFIKRVNEIIATNMKDERFGVSKLAREMHMSRSNLSLMIKSGTGISVSQLIKQ